MITKERQCWGRTKSFRRCRRMGGWKRVCRDHLLQPILLFTTFIVTTISLVADVPSIIDSYRSHPERTELQQEVLLEISLACHSWKVAYIALYPGNFQDYPQKFGDVWDLLEYAEPPRYSNEEWQRYRPLFERHAAHVRNRLNQLLTMYSDVLPFDLRTSIEKVKRRIEVEQITYAQIPILFAASDDAPIFFKVRFQEMIRVLGSLARRADSLSEELSTG